MGTVITFPEVWRNAPATARNGRQEEPASIIILPVVRIERLDDTPAKDAKPSGTTPTKRRRRRVTRS
jgi:hypothetical protein